MNFIFNPLFLLNLGVSFSDYRPIYRYVSDEYEFIKNKPQYVSYNFFNNDDNELNCIKEEEIKEAFERWKYIINKVTYYRLQFYNGKDRKRSNQLANELSEKFNDMIFEIKYEHSNFVVLSQKYFYFIEALSIFKSIDYIYIIFLLG